MHLEAIARAEADGGGGPLADAVHGQHSRLVEGRREEGAGRVALMVLGEQELRVASKPASIARKLRREQTLLEQLFLEPDAASPCANERKPRGAKAR